MIQTLVAALMWALVASLLILRRGRTDRNITYSALTIAIAMTLNVDAIYVVVDRVLGATNLATLLSDGLLMIGLFFLGRAAMKAGVSPSVGARGRWSLRALHRTPWRLSDLHSHRSRVNDGQLHD
jgi:hypothetical protein